jgi:outer membrane autotransporter protein
MTSTIKGRARGRAPQSRWHGRGSGAARLRLAALAFGVAGAAVPARADDVNITTSIVGTGLNLDPLSGTTVKVFPGVTVSNVVTPIPGGVGSTFPGIFASAHAWTLTNQGTVTASFGNGVYFKAGGTVNNSASISGQNAIDIEGSPGIVNNLSTGTIHGAVVSIGVGFAQPPVALTVTNAGSIDGGGVEGVTLQGGGMLTNLAGGTIVAHGTNNAVSLIQGSSRTVINSGTIQSNETGFATGVSLNSGTLTNNAGGKILGAYNGVWANGSGATSVTNAGLIEASRAQGAGSAIEVDAGGTVANSGTIRATTTTLNATDAGIQFTGAGTITNTGTIASLDGGLAIHFIGSKTHTLVLGTGSVLVGKVRGGTGTNALVLQGTGSEDIGKFLTFQTLAMQGTDWSLTGSGAFTTSTQVQGGFLHINGQLTSPAVSVLAGGTLGGDGTVVGALAVASGGTVAPGNSIGTLHVTGPVSFAAGSIYQVELNDAGQNDKLLATGTATLSGGTVQVLAAAGNYGLTNKYTILTANGGVNGTFAGATTSLAFFSPTLTYDANDVFLTLTRDTSAFASIAQTPNQHAVAGALDASAFGSALVQAVLPLSAPQALQAFDALSGEIHASAGALMFEDSGYLRQAVLGRLRSASFAGGGAERDSADMAGLAFGGPMLAYAATPAFPIKAPKKLPSGIEGRDVTFWMQDFGAWGRIDGDGNAAQAKRSLGGFFTGVDAKAGNGARAGLVAGYSRSDIQVGARASSAAIDSFHIGAYAGTALGALNLRSGAAVTWHDIATSRTIAFAGFADQASASYHGSTTQIFGELGYGMSYGRLAAEPFASFAFVHLATDAFTELGGPAALAGAQSQADIGYSTVGARGATNQTLPNGMLLTPRATLAWQHAFGPLTPAATLTFLSTAASFMVAGVPLAPDSALVDAGFDLRLFPHATIGVSYTGQVAEHAQDHALKGKLGWDF